MIQSARTQLTPDQFVAVRTTVTNANPGMSTAMAGRIVQEAVAFVIACAEHPGRGLAPSRVVDEGWHALILHTALYADLCARHGRFVHHYPGYDPTNYDPTIIDRTRRAIAASGFRPDSELWGPPTGDVLVSVAARCQHAPECTIRPRPRPEPPTVPV